MVSHAIEVRNLYKIFGPRGGDYVDAVKNGLGKAELNQKYGHVLGLRDINISMPAGGIMVVMGLSGSGKSTLIRHINRLIDPTAGEVLYDGVDVCRMNENDLREFRRHKTAMVFQKFALLPHRTVLENTVYGLEIQGVAQAEREKRAKQWIARVGLAGFENHYPNQLSGGMQQRVGLARALTNDADILLMDEAYSALDPLIRVDMQTVLLDLQKELKKTVVFITHDLDEALRLGDKIAILRDGMVVQQGTGQEIVLNPADEYITAFVKEVNRGRVVNVETIMAPLSGNPEGMPITTGTVLEMAARAMTAANQTLAHVVDEAGRPIGAISLSAIISSMVTPTSHEAKAA
ncbi:MULTISPECIES: quaternary amine ABC transporter ATP-binding protein [unclassified Shinella]|jgi:glycine betaine/proline transport system ATP-binding protein|uniref:quaternary amine ABC transporter ATP-binding protein n=1 Tax=unclassified Shinella TaxID=2643062 RepID=UPI0003C55434|nr:MULTISPECIES: glycine betaine/L-proline ABC transporter ATP-binding protein [unclassified Shinella]MCA0343582.1 glycine betaine/L-proline ABC transporter ATP-binding protein [Pseudomonadota bacterium]EYR77791.1 glycine betaine transport ATP-binding protein OpuAA [Shinella sp. DD12]KNY17899.1 glycine/betaine ABC transporter ATPase [Shinella sp. SUS2]KOC75406.1 glycine/betaine ABC transporter ATPase [Shinella sp. GWS1]MCO5149654.1 glycine betaine/L-proline ABC transporter ATP-binding protein 